MNNYVLNNSLYLNYSMDDLLHDLEAWEKEKKVYGYNDMFNAVRIEDLDNAVISSIREAYNQKRITYDSCFLELRLLYSSFRSILKDHCLEKRKIDQKTADMEDKIINHFLDGFEVSAYNILRVELDEDGLD